MATSWGSAERRPPGPSLRAQLRRWGHAAPATAGVTSTAPPRRSLRAADLGTRRRGAVPPTT